MPSLGDTLAWAIVALYLIRFQPHMPHELLLRNISPTLGGSMHMTFKKKTCGEGCCWCAGIWGVVVSSHGAQLCGSAAQPGLGPPHLHPLLAALAGRPQRHHCEPCSTLVHLTVAVMPQHLSHCCHVIALWLLPMYFWPGLSLLSQCAMYGSFKPWPSLHTQQQLIVTFHSAI